MVAIATVADIIVAALVGAKILAHAYGYLWLLRGGAVRLRREYMWRYRRHELPTRADDKNVGRPLVMTVSGQTTLMRIVGIVITTPGVVITSALISTSVATWAPSGISLAVVFALAMLLLLMCSSALVARAVLGPLDRLNPDLRAGGFESGKDGLLYPASDPDEGIYGRYIFVLLVCLTIGFTAVYANASAAVLGAFTGGSSADPIRWLYFTVTFAATLTSSDLAPEDNVGRLLVCAQLACTLTVAGTLVAALMPSTMPARDDPAWAYVDGDNPPSTRA